jgi:hypothetical protein
MCGGENKAPVLRDVFPASGITIWLQSQRKGKMLGNIFVSNMLFYGQAVNLEDGLKKICKQIRCQKPRK